MLRHDSLSQHVLHHLLPPRTDPAPSSDRGQVDSRLPVLFHIWLCRPRTLQNYFLMEPTPKALRHFCCVCFSSSQRLSATVPSFYVKCFGCSAKSTSCFEKLGGRQLRHVYFNDLKDDQEWFFSLKKSNWGEHAHISHPLKRSHDKRFTFSNLIKKIPWCVERVHLMSPSAKEPIEGLWRQILKGTFCLACSNCLVPLPLLKASY